MSLIERIINLTKKTRDKCIIVNPDSNDVFVILPFEEYERLLEDKLLEDKLLTEDKLLDKINRDIAFKISRERSVEGSEVASDFKEIPKSDFKEIPKEEGAEDEEKFYFEPIE